MSSLRLPWLSLLVGALVFVACSADQGASDPHISGLRDAAFDMGAGTGGNDPWIVAATLQSDDSIVVGGYFTSDDGTTVGSIARHLKNGAFDPTFNVGGTGINSSVSSVIWTMATQADDKILIGGSFGTYNGVARPTIARLNADGQLDTAFAPVGDYGGSLTAIVIQGDGKILVGGKCEGAFPGLARLNADGSRDTGFTPAAIDSTTSVQCMALQADGKIIIAGSFAHLGATERRGVARLNPDGSLDTSFDPGVGVFATDWGYVLGMALQADGKVVICGHFSKVAGSNRGNIARLNPDGSLDSGFATGAGADNGVRGLYIQKDGGILASGNFGNYDATNLPLHVFRLTASGSVDTSWIPDTNRPSGDVFWILRQSTGGFVVGGWDSMIARLLP